jgi:hypothetical protein
MKKKLLITMGCSFTEGVGCYDPEVVSYQIGEKIQYKKTEEVYFISKQRFHKYSWPSYLQKRLNYDVLINLGFGGSSTSGNVKVWFEKYYDKNLSEEFDVLLIWLLPIPSRFSFYRECSILNINPSMEKNIYNVHSYDIGREYIKFIDNIDLDPFLEQIFYLKIMEEHCQTKKYKFFYVPIDYNHNVLFEKLHNTKNLMKFTKSIFPNFINNPNMKSLICEHPNELGYEYISNQLFNWIELNEPDLISKTNPNTFESTWDGYPIFNHLDKIKLPI